MSDNSKARHLKAHNCEAPYLFAVSLTASTRPTYFLVFGGRWGSPLPRSLLHPVRVKVGCQV